jgi:hypothetical protein
VISTTYASRHTVVQMCNVRCTLGHVLQRLNWKGCRIADEFSQNLRHESASCMGSGLQAFSYGTMWHTTERKQVPRSALRMSARTPPPLSLTRFIQYSVTLPFQPGPPASSPAAAGRAAPWSRNQLFIIKMIYPWDNTRYIHEFWLLASNVVVSLS